MRFQPSYRAIVTCFLLIGPVFSGGSVQADSKVKYTASGPVETKKTVLGNGQVTITAPATATQQNTMSAEDLKTAKSMSEMYSRHVFQSICYQSNSRILRERGKDNNPIMTEDGLLKACGCQYSTLLKDYSPSEITDYISFSKGPAPKSRTAGVGFTPTSPYTSEEDLADVKAEPESLDQIKQSRSAFSKIAQYLSDAAEKKKCGFIR